MPQPKATSLLGTFLPRLFQAACSLHGIMSSQAWLPLPPLPCSSPTRVLGDLPGGAAHRLASAADQPRLSVECGALVPGDLTFTHTSQFECPRARGMKRALPGHAPR